MAFASEDDIEDELADIADDDAAAATVTDYSEDDTGAEDDDAAAVTISPDAHTFLLFTKPLYTAGSTFELPAGQSVEFLVGFLNGGADNFVVESLEASFRYPMDFNYYIQNFSAIPFEREVLPGHEATVSYSFVPADSFAGRPFGLNIALNYRDGAGVQYIESVFNETVNIVEVDEGLDGETFFLYVFLAAIAVLLLVVGQQFLAGSVGKRKRSQVTRKTIETGTTNSTDVDYEWLPEETLLALRKCGRVFGRVYWDGNEMIITYSCLVFYREIFAEGQVAEAVAERQAAAEPQGGVVEQSASAQVKRLSTAAATTSTNHTQKLISHSHSQFNSPPPQMDVIQASIFLFFLYLFKPLEFSGGCALRKCLKIAEPRGESETHTENIQQFFSIASHHT